MNTFKELFESQASEIRIVPGTILKGVVIDVNSNTVIVDMGLKSEALIDAREFINIDNQVSMKPNDEVELMVEDLDDGQGNVRLSREAVCRSNLWDELKGTMQDNKPIKAQVINVVKGGLIVDIGLFKAFLPRSLVTNEQTNDLNEFLDTEISCKIIKMDEEKQNIIVSRRVLFEASIEEKKLFFSQIEEGIVLKGTVKNLTSYGAFISAGPADGLLHITDMSWKRIKHPSDILALNQEIEVKVLKFDHENMRISFGMKQLQDDPWENFEKQLSENTIVEAEILSIVEYGAFAKIQEGVEGLIHASEIDWMNRNINTSKVLSVGQKVNVKILEINRAKRRISLSIKRCDMSPWGKFQSTYQVDDTLDVSVQSVTDFGVFVELPTGLNGLIHSSDLPIKEGQNVGSLCYQKGDVIKAAFTLIDVERERISLSVNRVSQIALDQFLKKSPIRSIVKGVVKKASKSLACIELDDGIQAVLNVNELSDSVEMKDVSFYHKVGDDIEAMIVGLDGSSGLFVSVKQMETSVESDSLKQYNQKNQDSQVTLGDAIADQANS